MPDRRSFILATGATALVAACGGGPPGPTPVTVAATASPAANGGLPVQVTILRLKDAGAFSSADYFALQGDPGSVLGPALVGMDQMTLAAGAPASKTIAFEPEATQIGVLVGLRDPQKAWRAAAPVPAGEPVTATVDVGAGGLALAMS